NFDDSPFLAIREDQSNSLYGDGKRTTLWALVEAYQATGEQRYLDRFKLAWNNLRTRSKNGQGLIDYRFIHDGTGEGDGQPAFGSKAEQPYFIELLLAAYHASRDAEPLRAAQVLAERMLAAGDSVMQSDSGVDGRALLSLALASTRVKRLEIAMDRRGRRLRIYPNNSMVAIF